MKFSENQTNVRKKNQKSVDKERLFVYIRFINERMFAEVLKMRKYVFIFITIIAVFSIAGISFGNTGSSNHIAHYKSIDVTTGDTLWEIAQDYKQEHVSTTEYVSIIKDFNNMRNDTIKIGQQIIIPIYK